MVDYLFTFFFVMAGSVIWCLDLGLKVDLHTSSTCYLESVQLF